MISVKELLKHLPPYVGTKVLVVEKQQVNDIIRQILNAHEKYAPYYDKIALFFDDKNIAAICDNIDVFLRENINYVEESEHHQTTALPGAILTTREGDCKHYSSFAGGVLAAISRLTGKKIDWKYRFASYRLFDKTPHHVYVVVNDKGKEIWIDPVPGSENLTPTWILDKKVKNTSMALYDVIAGIDQPMVEDLEDLNLPQSTIDAVQLLLKYGIIYENGQFDYDKANRLIAQLPAYEATPIADAITTITTNATIGGVISDAAHALAKVTLFAPRNAFLILVRLNFKNFARQINSVMTYGSKEDGDKLFNLWWKLGGDWDALVKAQDEGRTKKALGSIGEVVTATATATAATASTIIAAIIPVVLEILKKIPNAQGEATNFPVIPMDGGGSGLPPATNTGSGLMDFIKRNPLIVAAGAGALIYFGTKKKKTVSGKEDMLPILLIGGAALFLFRKPNEPATDPAPGTVTVIEEPGSNITFADPGNVFDVPVFQSDSPIEIPVDEPIYSPPNFDYGGGGGGGGYYVDPNVDNVNDTWDRAGMTKELNFV